MILEQILSPDEIAKLHKSYKQDTIDKFNAALREIDTKVDNVVMYTNSLKLTNDLKSWCKAHDTVDYSLKNYLGYFAVGDRFRNNEYVSVLEIYGNLDGEFIHKSLLILFGPDQRLVT